MVLSISAVFGKLSVFALQKCIEDGHMKKKLYVPRVEDKNSNMRMLNISCLDDLVANSMDILEPAPVDSNGNEREDGMASCLLIQVNTFIVSTLKCMDIIFMGYNLFLRCIFVCELLYTIPHANARLTGNI